VLNLTDLGQSTFNTLSFWERRAKLGDTNVEFHLLLKPSEELQNQATGITGVDKIVFEVPDQFGFPPVLYWNNCTMLGKYDDTLNYCRIDRLNR
jgi:hypothetical protein